MQDKDKQNLPRIHNKRPTATESRKRNKACSLNVSLTLIYIFLRCKTAQKPGRVLCQEPQSTPVKKLKKPHIHKRGEILLPVSRPSLTPLRSKRFLIDAFSGIIPP